MWYELLFFLGKLNKEETETEITLQMISEEIVRKSIQEQTLYACEQYSDWLQKHLNCESCCCSLVTFFKYLINFNVKITVIHYI